MTISSERISELKELAGKAADEVKMTAIICPTCGGSADIEEPNPFFDPNDDESDEDEFHRVGCPDCHGEAKVDVQSCPHCGSDDIFVERDELSSAYVFCNQCGSRGPTADQTSDNEDTPGGFAAIREWNRRSAIDPATLTSILEEVERLREVLTFYRDEFKPKIHKPIPGASGITFHPSEALLDDCGNRAAEALKGATP